MTDPTIDFVQESAGRRSMRGASAYLATAAAQRLISFVLLPLYALALTPSQFGSIAVLLSVAALMSPLLTFGLEAPLLRACIHKPDSKAVATMSRFLLIIPIAGGLALAVVAAAVAPLLDIEPLWLAMSVIAAGLTVAGSTLPMVLMRAEERFRSFANFVLVLTIASSAARLVAVVLLDAGVLGWVIADLVNGFLSILLGLKYQRIAFRLRGSWAELRRALSVGIPLVPHFLSHWGLNLSDRVILSIFLAPSLVGVYGVAYQVGSVSLLGVTELSRALMPRFGEAAKNAQARADLPKITRSAIVVCAALCSTVALGGGQALFVLFPDDFSGGASYIPWIAVAAFFLALYYVPINGMSLISADTSKVWVASLVAAVLNIGLNLWLVPEFGAVVAAINTTVGYLLTWLLVAALARHKGATVHWHPMRALLPLTLIGVGTIVCMPFAMQSSLVGLSSAVLMSLAVVAVAALYVRSEHTNLARIVS